MSEVGTNELSGFIVYLRKDYCITKGIEKPNEADNPEHFWLF